MSFIDLLIVALCISAAIGGYRLGFVTRVFSWAAMAVCLVLAVRFVLPWVLGKLPAGSSVTAFAVALLVVFTAGLLGQAIGFVVGGRVRPAGREGRVNRLDGVLGAVAGGLGAIVIVWLLLPLASATPGWVSSATAHSLVARQIDDHLPPAPDAAGAFRALVGDRFPQVFDGLRPTPDLGAPPADTGLSQATASRVSRSVVKVEGVACDRVQDGTGWVAADDTIVTNAHVVAGERQTQVQRDDGRFFDADVVAFDPNRDLAVLRVSKFGRPALPLAEETPPGTRGGVFGHPGGAPLRVAPFEVARQITAIGRDIYGSAPTTRQVLELRSALRPGDSGSALVDGNGRVTGVAFAIAPDQPSVAYGLAPSEVRAALAQAGSAPVGTGRCSD